MRIGMCGMDTKKYPLYKALGFDYIEANLATITGMSQDEFTDYVEAVARNGIKVEYTNCFFPGVKVVGRTADDKKTREYAKKALARAAQLGVKGCVFGSGYQRSVEEGEDMTAGYAHFIDVCRIMADEAKPYGIKIIIEPLCRKETNIVNTVADGIAAVKAVNRANVVTLVDFYHVFLTGESLDATVHNEGLVWHAHIARANVDRLLPHTAEDAEQCKIWARELKSSGYNGSISLEGGMPAGDEEEQLKKVLETVSVFR